MTKIAKVLALICVLLVAAAGLVSADTGSGYERAGGAGEAYCSGPGGTCVIADFIGSPTDGVAPLKVQFLDSSTGYPTMWTWDFGDGNTASGTANPVHIYTEPGIYTVTLTATSATGGTSTKVRQRYIMVRDKNPLEADFLANPTYGKAPLLVQFTDCSNGAVQEWRWDFGDGGMSFEQNPSHVYEWPGKYTVSLTVSSPTAGSSTKVKEKYIIVEPSCIIVADFSMKPSTGPAPLTVTFYDKSTGSPTMWSWDFGDGTTDMVANPTHTFTNPGEYMVTLTASSQYCETGTSQKMVKVTPKAIKADFSADPRSGDAPLTVQFRDLSTGDPTMWSWDFGDGASDMVANPIHTYTVPGTYTVTLTASNQYSTDMVSKSQFVTVSPKAIKADFVADPRIGDVPLTVRFSDLSTGNPTMWSWDFGDGATDMVANPTHVYTNPGVYSVTLTASNQYTSDSVTKTQFVTVKDVAIKADFVGNPKTGYPPLTVSFTDLSTGNPTMWSWDFGDGTTDMVASPVHTYMAPGTYTVRLTASSQYGSSDTVIKQGYITVFDNAIKADFDANPKTGCAPLTVTFTDRSSGSPTMWSWDFGDGTTDMVASPVHTYTEPGCYTVTLTASNQYGGTDMVIKQGLIVVESCPTVKAEFDGSPRSGSAPLTVSFTDLSSGNPTMWSWDFGDGTTDMVASPVHTYTQEGKYTVRLTASNTWGSDTVIKSDFIDVTTPYDDNIPLSGGWNFISVPRKLAVGADTASIFKNVDSGGHSMFQYDAEKRLWNVMDLSAPVRPLEGFWIFSVGSVSVPIRYDTNPVQTPPVAYLRKGWNGIGFTGTTPIEAKFTLLSVEDKWVNCVGYNAPAQQYDQTIIKGSNDGTLMYPFKGYWLYMTADGVLAANAA